MPEEHRELRARVIVIRSLWATLGGSSLDSAMMNKDGDDTGSAANSHGRSGGCAGRERINYGDERVEAFDEHRDCVGASARPPRTEVIIQPGQHTFSITDTTSNSTPISRMIPPSLEPHSFVEPDDSASVTSSASTGLRSAYEHDEREEYKMDDRDAPVYHHNVDYWRKNVVHDGHEFPFLGDVMDS
jgi:hypothetical protein